MLLGRIPGDEKPGCTLCKLILDDLVENGRLTGAPQDAFGAATFPPKAKAAHLKLEFGDLLELRDFS